MRSHWGGTETVILETCKHLQRMGHETQVICPNALAVNDAEVIEGVNVTRTPYFYPYIGLRDDAKSLLDLKGGNLFSFSLMKALKRVPDVDIIHLHTAKRTGGIGRHVALKRRIPYVVSLHGGVHDVPSEEAATWTEPTRGALEWGKVLGWWVGSRRVLDDAAAVVCVGEEERVQTQRRYPDKKVIHVANGVDPVRFRSGNGKAFRDEHAIPQDAFVLVTVGRIDPQKNQLFALKMLPELMRIEPRVYLLMVGPITNEPYYKRLLDHVRTEKLDTRVKIVPGVEANSPALADLYHAADVFLLPSAHEPFGIVILEAWAAGLPVIASRIGGIPSFVVSGEDGLLCEPNDEASFMQAFKVVCQNPELAMRLADAGRLKAESQFSWDSIIRQLVTIYEEAIRENPVRK